MGFALNFSGDVRSMPSLGKTSRKKSPAAKEKAGKCREAKEQKEQQDFTM